MNRKAETPVPVSASDAGPLMLAVFKLAPTLSLLLCMLLLAVPTTLDVAEWFLAENHPVELLTFLSLMAASLLAALVLRREVKGAKNRWVELTFAIVALGAFFTAMEEIAWGQWLLGFDTPESWRAINEQGETTFHNLKGFQGKTEIPRLFFGLAGLVAVSFRSVPLFVRISAPPILAWWFGPIAIHALVDLVEDFVQLPESIRHPLSRTSELTEMLIGLAAAFYAWWHWREKI